MTDWISNVCIICKYDNCTINIRYKHSSQNHLKRCFSKVPDSHQRTLELPNTYPYTLYICLKIYWSNTCLPSKKTNKKQTNQMNKTIIIFFLSFISAISSHSEKCILTFWRYKCTCTYDIAHAFWWVYRYMEKDV